MSLKGQAEGCNAELLGGLIEGWTDRDLGSRYAVCRWQL